MRWQCLANEANKAYARFQFNSDIFIWLSEMVQVLHWHLLLLVRTEGVCPWDLSAVGGGICVLHPVLHIVFEAVQGRRKTKGTKAGIKGTAEQVSGPKARLRKEEYGVRFCIALACPKAEGYQGTDRNDV